MLGLVELGSGFNWGLAGSWGLVMWLGSGLSSAHLARLGP